MGPLGALDTLALACSRALGTDARRAGPRRRGSGTGGRLAAPALGLLSLALERLEALELPLEGDSTLLQLRDRVLLLLALDGQLVLGHLEVFGGRLIGVDGVLVALGGVLRQRVGPGLRVDVRVRVAVPRGVAVDELLHGGVAHRVTEGVEGGLGRRRLGLERLDLGVQLTQPGLGLGQIGRRRVGPPPGGGEVAGVGTGARRDHDESQQHRQGQRGPRQSFRHNGRRSYKMLRTGDETASKSLLSGHFRHECHPPAPR